MTEEIKELLEHLSTTAKQINNAWTIFSVEECKGLYDYITNLQQENKILKENAEHNDKVVDKARWNEMIYKSRRKKAIEYIDEHTLFVNGGIIKSILNGSDDE